MGELQCKQALCEQDQITLNMGDIHQIDAKHAVEWEAVPSYAMPVDSLDSLEGERIDPFSSLQPQGAAAVLQSCACIEDPGPGEFVLAEMPDTDNAVVLCSGRRGAELLQYPADTLKQQEGSLFSRACPSSKT
mmetsp:Transcript_47479/g.65904  ORF Transcript_47479/g.65904 Transcript_47479/m.65904 type:complete len:133 (+) Transcript_47479:45-443(+)